MYAMEIEAERRREVIAGTKRDDGRREPTGRQEAPRRREPVTCRLRRVSLAHERNRSPRIPRCAADRDEAGHDGRRVAATAR